MINFKSVFVLILIILQSITFTSCNNKVDESKNVILNQKSKNINYKKAEDESDRNVSILSEYFAFKPNIKMVYDIDGIQLKNKEVYVDFINQNNVQIRETNDATEIGKVLTIKNGEIINIISKDEFLYRDDLINIIKKNKIDSGEFKNDIILKEPIKKGNKWSTYKGRKKEITNVNVKVNTECGKFNAIEVTTYGANFNAKSYYSPGIGLIKTIYSLSDKKITLVLKSIEKDSTFVQNIKFYYPKMSLNMNKGQLICENQNVQFKTNEKNKDVFEKYFKKKFSDNNIIRIMDNKVSINYLYLDDANKKVCVDFTRNFASEIQSSPLKENLIIQSITNTLGEYYNVDKVYISLDGKPYKSKNIVLNKDESFKVNKNDIKEKN